MNDYSDETAQAVRDTIEKWFDDFTETSLFKNLSTATQENAFFITSIFGEKMYDYLCETPEQWSADGLNEIITDVFPRKISADEDTFIAVEPILTAFFYYLSEAGHIKNADKLIKELKKAAPEMVEQATDSSNWGPAKQFVMSAMNEGVDLEDKREMDKFMQMYNSKIKSPPTFPAHKIEKSMPKVGRNEPCPCGSGKKYKRCCGKV